MFSQIIRDLLKNSKYSITHLLKFDHIRTNENPISTRGKVLSISLASKNKHHTNYY